jgi:hypothetical protein
MTNMQAKSQTRAHISEHCYNSGQAKLAGTTVGQRVYLVRLACGDGVRKAMPMREFAELLTGEGETFHASRISDIENDKTAPTLDEVDRIAAVDPLGRGRDWLGWGGQGDQGAKLADPKPDAPKTPPAIWRDNDPPYSVERLPATKRVPKGKRGRSAMAG